MYRAQFNELLISEVSKRRILWDGQLKEFSNSGTKERLWEEVTEAVKVIDKTVTVDEVHSRWKNLRDTFRKKMNDEKGTKKSGAAASSKSKVWPYMDQMQFLRDTLGLRKSFSNMEATDLTVAHMSQPAAESPTPPESPRGPDALSSLSQIFASPGYAETSVAGPSQAAEPGSYQRESVATRSHAKSRKRKQDLEGGESELSVVRGALAAHRPMDATAHFLLSLDPYLKATPESMQTHLKMEMLHILSQYAQGRYPDALLVKSE